jgi:hypothetical protein
MAHQWRGQAADLRIGGAVGSAGTGPDAAVVVYIEVDDLARH